MIFRPISKDYPLILASRSPRRKRLLTQMGLPFRPVKSRVREEEARGDPTAASRSLAEKKAVHVYAAIGASWVLGADTIVAIDGKMLGKPIGEEEARTMLSLLSGREHRVITGFCLLSPSGAMAHSEAVTTLVRFKKLTRQEIEGYIKTGEPFGKAGSYAIQGIGAFMVASISGSYTNVVGLPLCALIKALIEVGALKKFPLPPVKT
ncbi:MAG: septum formation protein Maf [Deltaproteobacteria bacterium]|nr:septum formation protein Maf [Deltaproteobacteria bacterium]